MIEAYRIGVALNLTNGLTGPLTQIVKQLQLAQKETTALQSVLSTLGKTSGAGMGAGIATLNKELQVAAGNVAKLKAEMVALSRAPAPGGPLNGMYPRTEASRYSGYGFGGNAPLTGAAAGGGGNFNYGTGARTNTMDAYGNGGGVRSIYAGGGGGAGAGGVGRSNPYESMFAGGLLAGAGKALITGPYEEAKKLAQAQADFSTLNLSAADNALVNSKALTLTQQVAGSTITGNIKALQDLHTAFGSLPHALEMAKNFQTFAISAEMKEGAPVEGLIYKAAKALEHRGGRLTNNPEAFSSELDSMSKVYFGSKGKVGPQDYFAASQTGKMAYKMYSPEFLYGPYASYVQEKTGTTAGTAGMTAFSSLIGGHMDSKAKGFLADLGGGIYEEGLSKSRVKLMRDAMRGAGIKPGDADYQALAPTTGGLRADYAEMFASNPDKFTNDVLVPAIKKKYGLDANIPLLLAKYFNRNTGDFLGEWNINKSKNDKDAKIFRASTGFNAALDLYQKTPQGAELAASSAWTNFLALFGSVYLPQITKALTSLATMLGKLSVWSNANPTIFKALVYGLTGLGIAGVVAGGVLLFGGALTMIAGISLAGIGAGFMAIGSGLLTLVAAIGVFNVAYGAGTWANNHLVNPAVSALTGVKNNTLGSWIYDKTHPEGSGNGDNGQYIAKKNNQQQNINNTIVMPNGEILAKVVTKAQSKQVNRPQSGTSRHDGGMSPQPVGASGSW